MEAVTRNLHVLNRGEIVGVFVDPYNDHGYFEGQFIPAKGAAGDRFASAASLLISKVVYDDWSKGIRVVLKSVHDTEEKGFHFVVMSLSEGLLFGRWILGDDNRAWAIENIPE